MIVPGRVTRARPGRGSYGSASIVARILCNSIGQSEDKEGGGI